MFPTFHAVNSRNMLPSNIVEAPSLNHVAHGHLPHALTNWANSPPPEEGLVLNSLSSYHFSTVRVLNFKWKMYLICLGVGIVKQDPTDGWASIQGQWNRQEIKDGQLEPIGNQGRWHSQSQIQTGPVKWPESETASVSGTENQITSIKRTGNQTSTVNRTENQTEPIKRT